MKEFPLRNPDGDAPEGRGGKGFAKAIARRMMQERLCDAYDGGIENGAFPLFFFNAMVDSSSISIESVLKAPSPYANFFTDDGAIIDNISDEDWNAFATHQGLNCSGQQAKLMMKAGFLATRGLEPRRPEDRFPHFIAMVQNAYLLAEERGVEASQVYEQDELYKELVTRSIPKDVYEAELFEIAASKSIENAALVVARREELIYQVVNRTDEVAVNGFTLDTKKIKKRAKKKQKKKKFRQSTESELANVADTDLNKIIFQLERFWG